MLDADSIYHTHASNATKALEHAESDNDSTATAVAIAQVWALLALAEALANLD